MRLKISIRKRLPIVAGRFVLLSLFGTLCAINPLAGNAQNGNSPVAPAQSPTSSAGDNPFPGAAPQGAASQSNGSQADKAQKPSDTPVNPTTSDNPFPGETNDAPIIPVDPGSGGNAASSRPNDGDSSSSGKNSDDPMRSPDAADSGTSDDGFTSSRNGLGGMPAEDDSESAPGKSVHSKTREQQIKEDLDIGQFYASKKNWKAAQERYISAFALDKENPDVVLGLAEAERHLQLWGKAREHYQIFLSYDPDGPHSRSARKSLEEVEADQSASVGAKNSSGKDSSSTSSQTPR